MFLPSFFFHHRAVGKAWTRVLEPGVETSFSPAADFFDLGGHSLLLAKLVSALADETGVTLSIQEIIERPTLDGMARLVEEAEGPVTTIAPTILPGLEATGVSISAEGNPVVLHDGSQGMVESPSSSSGRRGPVEGGQVVAGGGGTRVVVASAPAEAAAASVATVDLQAEARRLDAAIFPAGTRKTGCV